MTSPDRVIRVLAADTVDAPYFDGYVPRRGEGAGYLDYGPDLSEGLSSVLWLRERHMSSLGVPLSSGLFRMQPSEFDFYFVAEETIILLRGSATVTSEAQTVELGVGQMAFFPAGLRTHWQVVEATTLFFTLLD